MPLVMILVGKVKVQCLTLAVLVGTIAPVRIVLVLTKGMGCIMGFVLPTWFLSIPVQLCLVTFVKLLLRMLSMLLSV